MPLLLNNYECNAADQRHRIYRPKGLTNEVKVGAPIVIALLNPFLAWPKGIVTVGKEVLVTPLLRTTHHANHDGCLKVVSPQVRGEYNLRSRNGG